MKIVNLILDIFIFGLNLYFGFTEPIPSLLTKFCVFVAGGYFVMIAVKIKLGEYIK